MILYEKLMIGFSIINEAARQGLAIPRNSQRNTMIEYSYEK
jgi:hypothetical protein